MTSKQTFVRKDAVVSDSAARGATRLKRFASLSANIIIFVAPLLVLAGTFLRGRLVATPAQAISGALGLAAAHRALQRIISLLLIVAAWNLRRYKRVAWTLCLVLLTASLALSLMLPAHFLGRIGFLVEAYVLVCLILARDLYQRPSRRTTVLRAAVLAGIIMAIVVLNVAASQLWLFLHLRSGAHLLTAVEMFQRIGAAIGGANMTGGMLHQRLYARFVFVAFWLSVAICLFLVLRPATFGRLITKEEKRRARALLLRYGQNPTSYLTLEEDKRLFFGREVEGVIAYGLAGDTVVVNGDPICAPEDFTQLLAEFKGFCETMVTGCLFLCTTDAFLENYRALGYGVTKCGEEAQVTLGQYTLSGGAAMKLRQKVRRAANAGVTVSEYKPREQRDHEVEAAIARISHEWLAHKKSGLLGFVIGSNGLDDPLDRRYFFARDASGVICAYNVLIPFAPSPEEQGYLVDITRRLASAPRGVTELLVTEGFRMLKEEGVTSCTMGLAPLANVVDEEGKGTTDERLLDIFYNHLNRFYGFKDLHVAKKKYAPTDWASRYFVYTGKHLTPALVYAAIAIQSPRGLRGFVMPHKK